jgi:hypothetical protein
MPEAFSTVVRKAPFFSTKFSENYRTMELFPRSQFLLEKSKNRLSSTYTILIILQNPNVHYHALRSPPCPELDECSPTLAILFL